MSIPDHCHQHDQRWILSIMARLPERYRAKAAAGYSAEYQRAHAAEPVEHKKDGSARRSANQRLLRYVMEFTKNT